ncbi:MAG: peptide chain release factor N(5)-glutamine methyltransferase [Sideroxydans sp.]|nr:peptide chain release factor N(5)-glutamine methyltransferase [Sideroxydans sp.]
MRSIRDVLKQDGAELKTVLTLSADEARIEVQCLLQHVLHVQRAYLSAHPEQMLSEIQKGTYDALLQRRLRGEPVAHLLGEREFFGLSFKVTPDTLIPRPETELMVELGSQRISSPPAPLPLAGEGSRQRVLDLGTGTGAIAISIAHARPDVEVVAVDASEAALLVARENAQRLGVRNVNFVHSDWFSALDAQRFDLIVSNPPYIAADDVHLAQGDVRFEPLSALASGADGLDDIRRIIHSAPAHLNENGWLLLEHGYDQAESVRVLLLENGFCEIFSEKDLAGIERVSGGKHAPKPINTGI